MNLYKNQSTFLLLLLFFTNTFQHVCNDPSDLVYIEVGELGQGSQGKAQKISINRKPYVLKTFFNKGVGFEAAFREAFILKVLNSKDLQKNNVVNYERCFNKDNTYKILMEYLPYDWDKFSFKSRIKEKTEKQRAQIYKDLISKIKFIHDQGFLHCDIKPDNILCFDNIEDFKIADFGLSKYQNEVNKLYRCSQGADGYVSPETFNKQIQLKDAIKYDMYSIGIIIAQIESNRSCNILNQAILAQNKIYKQEYYDKFIQYVNDCLQQNNQYQKNLNSLINDLLIKDESKRLNEQQAINLLDQIIYDGQKPQQNHQHNQEYDLNDFEEFQKPNLKIRKDNFMQSNQNQFRQFDQQQIRQNIIKHHQLQQQKQDNYAFDEQRINQQLNKIQQQVQKYYKPEEESLPNDYLLQYKMLREKKLQKQKQNQNNNQDYNNQFQQHQIKKQFQQDIINRNGRYVINQNNQNQKPLNQPKNNLMRNNYNKRQQSVDTINKIQPKNIFHQTPQTIEDKKRQQFNKRNKSNNIWGIFQGDDKKIFI